MVKPQAPSSRSAVARGRGVITIGTAGRVPPGGTAGRCLTPCLPGRSPVMMANLAGLGHDGDLAGLAIATLLQQLGRSVEFTAHPEKAT